MIPEENQIVAALHQFSDTGRDMRKLLEESNILGHVDNAAKETGNRDDAVRRLAAAMVAPLQRACRDATAVMELVKGVANDYTGFDKHLQAFIDRDKPKPKAAKKLKSLDAHNREVAAKPPAPNGLACPKCGEELFDSTPGIVLESGKLDVHCVCGYRGLRAR